MVEGMVETPHFLIFLDFDGVVKHPGTNSFVPECVTLVRALANRLDAHIVISSSWRSVIDIARLNEGFDDRIIGVTPTLDGPESMEDYARHKEVRASTWPMMMEVRGIPCLEDGLDER
jgi:hypothetical protein